MTDKKAEASAPPTYDDAMYPKQPGTNPGMVQPPYPPQAGVYQPPYPPQPGAAPYPVQGGVAPYPTQPGVPAYPPQQPAMAANQNVITGGYDSDVEGGNPYGDNNAGFSTFSDKAIRRGFIRKVYVILCAQLILTGGIIAAFMGIQPLKEYTMQNQWIYWTAFGVMIVCMCSMVCCEGPRRKTPMNFIFLGIFTAAEGLMLGSVCVYFEAEAVLIAVGICAGVTLGLTLFSFQTKIDFTNCGGMLCALLMVLCIAGLCMAFIPGSYGNKWAMIGYGSAGALVFSLYIVYDTQLMMGGKHKYALSPEEYVFASLNLYLDIINLFLYILMIVGAARGD